MEAWIEMQNIFDTLSTTNEVRVIVLKGEGKHFCARSNYYTSTIWLVMP